MRVAGEPSITIEPTVRVETRRQPMPPRERLERIFAIEGLDALYAGKPAIKSVSMDVYRNLVTAVIGPSGCGKSTFIRCLNRMNDLIPGASVDGRISYHGHDLNGSNVDPVELRRRIGMVFQRPTPFPTMSIRDNVAAGLRVLDYARPNRAQADEIVERALVRAALWNEVKDRLSTSAIGLSGGQQQRLCIARVLATEPRVLLLDEPTASLDPLSTRAIEELLYELRSDMTIVIVTHNMQQAARVSDSTAFFLNGELVEMGDTNDIFTTPRDDRTEAYITGRFG